MVDRLANASVADPMRQIHRGSDQGTYTILTHQSKRAQQAIVDTDDPTYEQIRTRVAGVVPEPEATSVAALLEGLSAILEAQPDVRG
ncbi:hypothetical protein [Rathayibacter agropyri]|uniref:hypothetical protein n=1 Tax=Rathayibacter agropyri TaxID=1634927 RepID=UPI001566F4E0|nr:hypothetical protein [Rathayibacter agropyri]NRD10003.1 hypothetical protein [Rathayibacter agropyri]